MAMLAVVDVVKVSIDVEVMIERGPPVGILTSGAVVEMGKTSTGGISRCERNVVSGLDRPGCEGMCGSKERRLQTQREQIGNNANLRSRDCGPHSWGHYRADEEARSIPNDWSGGGRSIAELYPTIQGEVLQHRAESCTPFCVARIRTQFRGLPLRDDT